MSEYLKRYIEHSVSSDLKRKMVFIGGPRQGGKTTTAKRLCQDAGFDIRERYLNWDSAEDREKIILERSSRNIPFVDDACCRVS
ncbi:MAG TPA: hypothetical protein HPP59_06010 [Deltaproteobacteria bacterium]|nr:hypothetical protein [Deltaproteobacteria bacterium]HIJ41824.1 hypothetical protein [Deltaproteobacteria bacterium]